MHSTSRLFAATTGLAATVLLAGCGAGAPSTPSQSPSQHPSLTTPGTASDTATASTAPTTGDGTALTVIVTSGSGTSSDANSSGTYRLTCEPTGGDHPRAEAACAEVLAADTATFAPVPPNVKCTMLYGGPQEATVTGTIRGAAVQAHFSLTNGCEIGRWDALPQLLGPTEN